MTSASKSLHVSIERVSAFRRLLDPDAPELGEGDNLPPLWHWVALPEWSDPADTGHDGHPRRTGVLSAVDATRRMFAGGLVEFSRPLVVGERVTVQTRVRDVVTKHGRSGEFVLATLESRFTNQYGDLAIQERQDIVYMAATPDSAVEGRTTASAPIVGRPFQWNSDGSGTLVTDPTILLRFSALTANGHRIHYDPDYARGIEGLAGLLVHGPLLNIALVHAATRGETRGSVTRVAHRNLRPLICGTPAQLRPVEVNAGETTLEALAPSTPSADPEAKSRVTVSFQHSAEK